MADIALSIGAEMNKRFKELANQATEYANQQNELHGVGYVITFKDLRMKNE